MKKKNSTLKRTVTDPLIKYWNKRPYPLNFWTRVKGLVLSKSCFRTLALKNDLASLKAKNNNWDFQAASGLSRSSPAGPENLSRFFWTKGHLGSKNSSSDSMIGKRNNEIPSLHFRRTRLVYEKSEPLCVTHV